MKNFADHTCRLFRPCRIMWLALFMAALLPLSCTRDQPAPPASPQASTQPLQNSTSQTSGRFSLGPDDEIAVTVWRHDDLNTTTTIDPSGHIDMPLIGRVQAADLTPTDLAKAIETRLAEYIHEPRASVSISNVASRRIYVLGEVNQPGMFAMSDNMGAWEAVAMAGGFTGDADLDRLIIVRERLTSDGWQAVAEGYSLAPISRAGRKAATSPPRLSNRDIIYVPASGIATVGNFMSRIDTILRPVLSTASVIVLSDSAYDVFFPQAERIQGREPIAISP